MYTPPFFKQDRAASLKFADTRGFGTMCAFDGHKPIASPIPFYLTYAADGTPQAAFHVARHNPLLKLADGTTSWLLAVSGPDAYVSPDWYVSPDQVPTWLYQSVHLTGPVRLLSDGELAVQIDTLSNKFENWLLPRQQPVLELVAERIDLHRQFTIRQQPHRPGQMDRLVQPGRHLIRRDVPVRRHVGIRAADREQPGGRPVRKL